jgi:hypothetical protein
VEYCGRARQATDENVIRRMRFAGWIIKAAHTDTHTHAHTHTIYHTYLFSTATDVMREQLILLTLSFFFFLLGVTLKMWRVCVTRGMILRGNPNFSEENLFQQQFVHHKSYME